MTPLLEIRDLHKHYTDARGAQVRAVNGVSFTINRGEVLGLGGISGAGRTEIAKALFGVDRLTGGELRIDSGPGGTTVRVRVPV